MTFDNGKFVVTNTARELADLPGPRGAPLLGNVLQLDIRELHLILEHWAAQYGSIYLFRLGPKPVVVIADAEINNQILRDRPGAYRRITIIESVLTELGLHGVFSAEGEDWRQQRRLAMQALSTKHLRTFFPTMQRIIERLERRWKQAVQKGTTVDVQKDFMRLTVDVTTNLTFGYDINTLEKEGDVLQDHLEKVFPMLGRRINALFPYWRYLKLPSDHALDRSLVEIHKAIRLFIDQARQRMLADPTLHQKPTNFLEAMFAEDGSSQGGAGTSEFTDEEIVGNTFTMLLAGEDTTANTLSWMLYYMCLYPEVQGKMQAEADSVLGRGAAVVDLNQVDKLIYIEAVANEAMRLRPVAPLLTVEPNNDVEVAGVRFPQGTSLFLLNRPGVTDERNFARAQEFLPERWLTNDQCPFHGAHNPQVHIPFGHGPRLCPGRTLALLEIKATMAMLCRQFDVTAVDLQKVRELWAFTMMPVGLLVRFSMRA